MTDRHTHRQTLHADRPRLCIASSGKKTKAKGRATSARSKKQCVSSVFSRLLNVGSDHDGDEVTSAGRLFHTRAAATGNARSPTVDSRVTWHDECVVSTADKDQGYRRPGGSVILSPIWSISFSNLTFFKNVPNVYGPNSAE